MGLSLALSRSTRAGTLIAAAALGGGFAGLAVQLLSRWGLAALLGLDVAVGGGLVGVAIGAAAGTGYALGTRDDDLAGPSAAGRRHPALVSAVLCGLAGLALTLAGHPLVGGTIHAIAHAAEGSRATLAPLGRLIGERDFGPVTSAIIAFGEAAMFGLGVAFGLIRRSRGGQAPVSARS
jgi:hypothetical protein